VAQPSAIKVIACWVLAGILIPLAVIRYATPLAGATLLTLVAGGLMVVPAPIAHLLILRAQRRSGNYIPFTGFAVVVILVLLWIRCPRCGTPLGQNAGFLNSKDRFYQKRVNFCSHCGVNFDDPYSVVLTAGSSESRAASSVSQGGSR